jgi:arginyl-tRNA synthetase
MSTRKGNIIKLDSLLDEAVQRAKNILLEKKPEVSETDLAEISEII